MAAEDAAQIGFEKALLRWRRVGQYERPGTWVYVVAVRTGRRQLARDQRSDGEFDPRSSAEPGDADLSRLWLEEAIDQLPPRQRTVVVLRHLADLPLGDIAEAMQISLGTLKSTLHAAHKRLRVELDEQPDEKERTNDAS